MGVVGDDDGAITFGGRVNCDNLGMRWQNRRVLVCLYRTINVSVTLFDIYDHKWNIGRVFFIYSSTHVAFFFTADYPYAQERLDLMI